VDQPTRVRARELPDLARMPLRCPPYRWTVALSLLVAAACSSGADDTGDALAGGSSGSSGSSGSGGLDAAADAATDGRSQADATTEGGADATTEGGADATTGGFAYKPVPAGCVTDVTPGNHTFTCDGLTVTAAIPNMLASCPPAGCGLILELHGDTGTGPLMDQHTDLLSRGATKGYVVIAPTGPAIGTINGTPYPGSTWTPSFDAKLVSITQTFASVFKPDAKRLHVAGFSRGGFAGWRLACDQSNLFASVAIGGAGNGAQMLVGGGPEATCFEGAHYPARGLDMLMLIGRTDLAYPKMISLRANAISHYGLVAGDTTDVQAATATVIHQRSAHAGKPVVEWFDHGYEVDPTNADVLLHGAKGHCIPGSKVPLGSSQYNIACKAPTAVDWGAETLSFFEAHHMP